MKITSAGNNSTMTTAFLLGCALSVSGFPAETSGYTEQTYPKKESKHGGYNILPETEDTLQLPFSMTEHRQALSSPKHMMNILTAGLSDFLASLHTSRATEIETLAQKLLQAENALADLSKALEASLVSFSGDAEYSREVLLENSLVELIGALREAEQIVASRIELTQPQAIDHDYLVLRKALAQTRALAVRTQKMIDQRVVEPEVFVGRASPTGLDALASMATKRLQHVAG